MIYLAFGAGMLTSPVLAVIGVRVYLWLELRSYGLKRKDLR